MTVWVFIGNDQNLPSGVFTTRARAEVWIRKHNLTGLLTEHPIDVGGYEWAVQQRRFVPRKAHHGTPAHIVEFTSGVTHDHYVDGRVT